MASGQLRGVVNQLRRIVGRRCGSALTDAQLLEDFVSRRDQASFEVLVWRHGGMVLNLCQRILRDSHEAEDAFQAAFLIFARKARSIGKQASVGSWLYKVAYRVALRVRAKTARRASWEKAGDDLPARQDTDVAGSDLRPVLDEEIGRLPEKYRAPLVLCYLEGHTNEEAAEQLGCPKGTILSRLARGRERLRSRLTRRGLALSAAALATALSESAASAALPTPLVAGTVEAALAFAAGQAAAGLVSASVAALSEGVIHAMFLTKVKIAAALLAVAVAGTGFGIVSQRTLADTERSEVPSPSSVTRSQSRRPIATDHGLRTTDLEDFAPNSRLEDAVAALGSLNLALAQERRERGERAGGERGGATQVHGTIKSVDVAAGKITLTTFIARDQPPVENTYTLGKDVEVAVGFAITRGSYFKEGKVADLAEGVAVHLTLAADKQTVESILAEEPTVRGARLKSVDAAKGTLSVTLPAERSREAANAAEEKSFQIAKDVEVLIDDGRGGRFSHKEGKLADLGEGAWVTLRLSIDKQRVQAVIAEGPTHQGTVKDVDTAKRKLTLTIRGGGRGEDGGEELSLQVPEDAVILLDDGRGRLLSIKPGRLSNVPPGSSAAVRLTVDQQFVASMRVQGPTVSGILKGVDAKGSITIAIPKGRNESEEKTFTVAKNAHVSLDGTATRLADIKISDDGPHVQLRMSLDQTMVQSIMAATGGRSRR